MAIFASQLLSVLSASSVTVATAACGVVGYVKRETLFPFWFPKAYLGNTDSAIDNETNTSSKELVDVLEEPVLIKPKAKRSASTLDVNEFDYLVAKFTQVDGHSYSDQKLFSDNKADKQYVCEFQASNGESFKNANCEIYKLSSQYESKDSLLDISYPSNTTQIKENTDLKKDSHYIVKLSKTFLKQFGYDNKHALRIISKTSPIHTFGSFIDFVNINKDIQLVQPKKVQSNLFIAELTKGTDTTGAFDHSAKYTCKIAEQTAIPCKIYTITKTNGSFTKAELDLVKKIGNIEDSLTTGKYIVVDLLNKHTVLSQLKGKLEIFKGDETKPLVTGVADHLVVGTIDETTNTSNLFIPKDDYGTLTNQAISDQTKKSYLVTKTIAENDYLKKSSYVAANYICRVLKGDLKYDDESCKLFPLFIKGKTYFELTDYKTPTDQSHHITDYADLVVGKHQVLEIAKELSEKLTDSTASLHLINKDRKDKPINNIVFGLSKEKVLHEDSAETTVKSDLFLFRYKDGKPAEEKTLTNTDPLTCEISGEPATPAIKCKIFKFDTNPKENFFTQAKNLELKPVTSTNSFVSPVHFFFEFEDGNRKSFDELKNKKVTLKQNQSTLGTFDFVNIIYGIKKVSVQQLPPKKLNFLVVKTLESSRWTDLENATFYRCKLPVGDSQETPTKVDNIDYACKLIKIPADQSSYIETFSSINSASTELQLSELKTVEDSYFKLVLDSTALYNFEWKPESSGELVIDLEVMADAANTQVVAGQTKPKTIHIKKLKVMQEIKDAPITLGGNANIVLTELTTDPTDISDASVVITDPQCAYSDAPDTKFDCAIHAVSNDPAAAIASSTDISKFTPTYTPITNSSEITKNKQYLIKLDGKKKISELQTNKSINYYYSVTTTDSSQEPQTTTTVKQLTLNIKAFLEGNIETNKQLFFIADPVTSQP